jgi:hypothetical protein
MRKAKLVSAVSLFALFLLAYGHTSSLSVSWKNFSEDSGDFLAAAYTLGIPHPTGYPLYVLLGRIFSLIMPGSIAFRITLLSLLCASLAPVFLFLTLARLLPRSMGLMGAAVASLSLGFSLYFWSQAVVAEVYTFHVLFLSMLVYLAVRWMHPEEATLDSNGVHAAVAKSATPANGSVADKRSDAYFLLSAYVLGLSFTNHMLSTVSLVFAAALVFSGPARKRIRPPLWILALVCFLIPLTLYAYLPIRSMRDPELDWGNPETWRQFKWVVTGEQYRFRLLALPMTQALAKLWPGPFLASGWPILALSATGLLSRRLSGALRTALVSAIVADLLIVVLYDIPDFPPYFLPASFGLCFLAGAGFERVLSASAAILSKIWKAAVARLAAAFLAAALIVAVLLPAATHNRRETDASTDLYAYVFGRATFRIVEPNALVISEYDGRTFALWFFRQTEFKESHPDCIVILKYLLVWPWYVDNLKKLHPDLSMQQAGPMDAVMLSLVGSNVEKRPIYTVRDDPALRPFYCLRPIFGGEIELFRVEKMKSSEKP